MIGKQRGVIGKHVGVVRNHSKVNTKKKSYAFTWRTGLPPYFFHKSSYELVPVLVSGLGKYILPLPWNFRILALFSSFLSISSFGYLSSIPPRWPNG